MLGNFCYSNPTKLYFGEDALHGLSEELKNYGRNVLLVYGGGSINHPVSQCRASCASSLIPRQPFLS